MIAIEADSLCVTKKKTTILHDINFTLQAGTITGLIGPSGSGKTTLLRAIVGAQQITRGRLAVLGRPAGSAALRPLIGYVTQSPAVYDDLSVTQNIRYFATLVATTNEHADKVIETVHLAGQKDQLAASLSGGQKARLSLAIALLGDPELLVLDEPTVGLDPILRLELWRLFSDLAAQGKSLIISSHVMDEADKCSELLLIRDGTVLWNDSRAQLLASTGTASVEAAFIVMMTPKAVD